LKHRRGRFAENRRENNRVADHVEGGGRHGVLNQHGI
jgi:hypothetical protein